MLPSPTAADAARDAAQEAEVLGGTAEGTIDALVAKLTALEAHVRSGQSQGIVLADDDELQGLYQRALAVSPHVSALAEQYTARTADLRALNDHFVAARARFDAIVPPTLPVAAAANAGPGAGTQQAPHAPHQHHAPFDTPQASGAAHTTDGVQAAHGSTAQPPPDLDPSSPEYARWYYSVFPQAQAQAAQ